MRTKKSLLSFIVQNFRMITGILVSFIAAPLLLKFVGEERFGTYRVLFDVYSYFGIIDVGIFGSMMLVLNKAIAKNDLKDKWATIYASKKIYYKLTSISVLVFLGFIPFLNYFIPTETIPFQELLASYLIMGMGIFFLTLKVNQAYLEANQMGYLIGFGLTFQNLCYSVIAIFLGYLGYGLIGMTIGFAIGQLLPYFYYLYKFHKITPKIEEDISNTLIDQKKRDIWHIQWPVLLTSLTGRLSIYSDTIIISKFMSPLSVTAFFISQRVISIAGNFLMGISGSTWAAMGELYNSNETEKFRDLFFRITKFIAVTSAIVAIPLILMSRSFVSLWVGEHLYVGDVFIIVAVINLFIQSVLTFWGWCFTVTHKVHRLIKLQVVSTIVNIVSSIFFTVEYGHVGPILGTLFSYFVIFIWWMMKHLEDVFNFKKNELLLSFIPSLVYICAASVGGYYYIEYFNTSTWTLFFIKSALCFSVNFIICLALLFSKEERSFFINRFKNIKK